MTRSISIEFQGRISEDEEMLDGTRQVVLEGRADGQPAWEMTMGLAWLMGLEAALDEGDIALRRGDGSELYGNLRSGRYVERGEAGVEGAVEEFTGEFEIEGGGGEFEGCGGEARVRGGLEADSFRATVEVLLVEPDGGQRG